MQDTPVTPGSARFANVTFPGPLVELSARWVRVRLGDAPIADSRRTLLARDYLHGHLPTYYFPRDDVRMDLLVDPLPDQHGIGMTYWTVKAGDLSVENGAWAQASPPPGMEQAAGYITFKWRQPLTWYEEEEQLFAHARDPYHRVDVRQSSRHVRVAIDGTTVAETRRPSLLFETGLPTRYYIPPEDVRMDLLQPTDRITQCPYKGIASYWSARLSDSVEKNLVWSYQDPLPDCPKIKGLMCFFNERVDLYVDGELQPRPQTPWSLG